MLKFKAVVLWILIIPIIVFSQNKDFGYKEKYMKEKYGNHIKIRWNSRYNTISSIYGGKIDMYKGTPYQMAKSFFSDEKELFGINDFEKELRLAKNKTTKKACNIFLEQIYNDVKVASAGYSVSVSGNEIYYISGNYYNDININTTPIVSFNDANVVLLNKFCNEKVIIIKNELIIIPIKKEDVNDYKLMYEYIIKIDNKFEKYRVIIDAQNGSIFLIEDMVERITGSGNVYEISPDFGQVVTRNLYDPRYNLYGNSLYYLWHDRYSVTDYNPYGIVASSTNGVFNYSTSSIHFDEVMVFYHAQEFIDWISQRDFDIDELLWYNIQVRYDGWPGWTYNENYCNEIGLPDGNLNSTELNNSTWDATVICHELMHGVSEEYNSLDHTFGGNYEDPMDEAYSDYFSVKYVNKYSPTSIMGKYFDKDGGTYDFSRNLNNNYTMSNFNTINLEPDNEIGDQHDRSVIFSGALWNFSENENVDSKTADELILHSINDLDNNPTFEEAREAIIAEDIAINNGDYVNIIKHAFYLKEIGDDCPTTEGALAEDEDWEYTQWLTGDVTVPTGITLTLTSGSTVKLKNFNLKSTGGVIDKEYSVNIDCPVYVNYGSTTLGYFSTISDACNYASSTNQMILVENISGYTHDLDADVTVPSGTFLLVESGSTINLTSGSNNYSIVTDNSSISLGDNVTLNPDIRLMDGTDIKGLYSTLEDALTDAGTGDIVEVRDDYSLSNSLTLGSGKTIKFASGKYLEIESGGSLIASGATFTNISGTWGGIKYNSGSSGGLTNCTISNSTHGVYLNGSNRTIADCNITNSTYGIYCANTDPFLDGNTVSADYGVYCFNSSPELVDNSFTQDASTSGLYCTSSSSPTLLRYQPRQGYNDFGGSFVSIAVYASSNSNPVLGLDICSEEYGNNTFNYGYVDDWLVRNENSTTIKAEHCYWGGTPSSSLFYGSVDYDPILADDPNSGPFAPNPEGNMFDQRFMLASAIPNGNEEVSEDLTQYYNEQWNLEKKIDFLRYLYILGETNGVADLCKDIIFENLYAPEAFTALDLIYQISKNEKIKKDIDKDMFKTYLKTFEDCKSNKLLEANAMLLLAGLEKDVKRMDKVYKEHKNDYMGKYALYQQFMYYFHEEEDMEKARVILNELDEVYPDEDVTYESHLLMGDDVVDPIEYYSKYKTSEQVPLMSTDVAEVLPEEYSLNPAYPNPFNPSTTLEYALPVQSEVECSIYDLSGNLVKEFFFNQYAGTHSITWNADQYSSGIYLVRFTAKAVDGTNSFVDYQKVTLLK